MSSQNNPKQKIQDDRYTNQSNNIQEGREDTQTHLGNKDPVTENEANGMLEEPTGEVADGEGAKDKSHYTIGNSPV